MFGSRTSNKQNFINIASRRYIWKSKNKAFEYYDSDAGERVALEDDTVLVPLTATMSVTGVHERDHNKATQRYNSVFSNEFTNFKQDVVKVQEKDRLDGTKTVIAEGVYSPVIKDAIADLSYAKFTKNLYCVFVDKGGKKLGDEVVKVSLSGSSLTPWIELENQMKKDGNDIFHGFAFSLGKPEQKKNGAVSFNAPTFKSKKISEELDKQANEKAVEVEEKILRNKQAAGTEEPTTKFTPPASKSEDTSNNDEGESGDTISIDEVPF